MCGQGREGATEAGDETLTSDGMVGSDEGPASANSDNGCPLVNVLPCTSEQLNGRDAEG